MRISHSDFSEPGMRLAQFELQKEQLIERFGNAACAGFEERVKKRISCCGEDLAIAAEILRVQIWVYDTLGMQNAIKPTVAVVRDPIHIENCVLTDSAGASTEHYMLLMKDGHDALKRPWETPTTKLQEQKISCNGYVDGFPAVGLNVNEPYIGYILDGSKTWEIRNEATTRRGLICLVNAGKIFGTVCLKECKEISIQDLKDNPDLHRLDDDWMKRCSTWKKIYAWILTSPTKLENHRRFVWKIGCVNWCNISFPPRIQLPWKETDITNATSADELANIFETAEKQLPIPNMKFIQKSKASHHAGVSFYNIRCKDC